MNLSKLIGCVYTLHTIYMRTNINILHAFVSSVSQMIPIKSRVFSSFFFIYQFPKRFVFFRDLLPRTAKQRRCRRIYDTAASLRTFICIFIDDFYSSHT